jgi:hypothetical protein
MRGSAVQDSKWSRLIENYLVGSDIICDGIVRASTHLKHSVKNEDFGNYKKSFVLRVTLCGIIATILMLLVSCQSTTRRYPLPRQSPEVQRVDNRTDPLYIRRESARVAPRVPESLPGSIYAATRKPLDLFSDETPNLAGEFVTIQIPDDLQFKPQLANKSSDSKQTKSSSEKNSKDPENALIEALSKDIPSISHSNSQGLAATKALKMEIVAVDNGTVYLRGSKTFVDYESAPGSMDQGTNRGADEAALTITAQVKQTAIKGKVVDASELSQVEVIRFDGRKSGSYRADGWDVAVSRQLSSYTPDVDSDLERLRQYETTLSEQQRTLTDRFRALKQEQNRFKREQARAGDRSKTAANDPQAQNAGNRNPNAPNETAPAALSNTTSAALNNTSPAVNATEAAAAATKPPPSSGGNP